MSNPISHSHHTTHHHTPTNPNQPNKIKDPHTPQSNPTSLTHHHQQPNPPPSPHPTPPGVAKDIAQAAFGKYHYIPKATDRAVAEVASMAIADIKQSKAGKPGRR